MPILLGVLTFLGLISAIIGTGIWHVLSWIALSIPLIIAVKHGRRFFEKKKKKQRRRDIKKLRHL
jgi:membrane protein implicated in regulation of membrane protease activity